MYRNVLVFIVYRYNKTTRGRKTCCIWKQFPIVYIEPKNIEKSILFIYNDILYHTGMKNRIIINEYNNIKHTSLFCYSDDCALTMYQSLCAMVDTVLTITVGHRTISGQKVKCPNINENVRKKCPG